MLDLSAILNISDGDLDAPQMGLSKPERAKLLTRGVTKDGEKIDPSIIKADVKLSDVTDKQQETTEGLRKTTGDPDGDKRLAKYREQLKRNPSSQPRGMDILEDREKADPLKYESGDKVGFKVVSGGRYSQTNKGFQIVNVNSKNKIATIKQVRDTGLTTSGGNNDRVKPFEVHVAELFHEGGNPRKNSKQQVKETVNIGKTINKKDELSPVASPSKVTVLPTTKKDLKALKDLAFVHGQNTKPVMVNQKDLDSMFTKTGQEYLRSQEAITQKDGKSYVMPYSKKYSMYSDFPELKTSRQQSVRISKGSEYEKEIKERIASHPFKKALTKNLAMAGRKTTKQKLAASASATNREMERKGQMKLF